MNNMTMNNRILELRKKNNLTQEELAEKLGISRQSIQKWEKQKSLPDSAKLIQLSKLFHVSVDYLLGTEHYDNKEDFRITKKIVPDYSQLHRWEAYSLQLHDEYKQCMDEGIDIQQYKDLMDSISQMEISAHKEKLADIVFELIQEAPQVSDYKYKEPDDWDSIVQLSDFKHKSFNALPNAQLRKKIEGAWLGRICGCLLGKTVEGIRTDELIPLLKETNNYPMHRYILKSDMSEEIYLKYKYNLRNRCFADDIKNAPSDDDTNYTVLSAVLIDEYTDEFTSENLAKIWLERQPKNAYCTAERVAYLNFLKGYAPAKSAVYKNPFREWIGAQIRTDYYGYINPGNPIKAAKLAWKDARISHVKNGIYGAMWVSAMLSLAAHMNIYDTLKESLSYIPSSSRLYEKLQEIIQMYDNKKDSDYCLNWIHQEFNEFSGHDWCHTISNACVVAASLLYGGSDFSKSICLSVQAGFDTDCNGATVGSIVGMNIGADQIPTQWSAPINNKVDTSIFGVGTVSVDYIVDMAMKHIDLYAQK